MWTFVIFVVSFFILKKLFFSSPNNLPPGPYALPLLGNLLQIGRQPHITFDNWRKIYGPIFRIKMCRQTAVVISDYKMINELYSDKVSGGRPPSPLQVFSKGNYGVMNTEGKDFETQKAFILRTLRDLGISKKTMDYIVLAEVKGLTGWIESKGGAPIDGNFLFNKAVANVLVNVAIGFRYEWEKGDPSPLVDVAIAIIHGLNVVCASPIMFAPWLKYVAPKYFGWTDYVKSGEEMMVLIDQQVEDHKKTLDPANIRDFIDAGLVEVAKCEDPESCFYKEKGMRNLKAQVIELFLGGSESTATMLSWCMVFLSKSPQVQQKLQDEIDQVLGRFQPPSIFDREKMTYTKCVITEVFRLAKLTPFGVPHKLREDTHFHGYVLPKGTVTFANVQYFQGDPSIWGEDTKEFKPERYLSEEGIVLGNEAVLPFSVGYRKCMGYSLALDVLFIFLVSLFQKYTILPGEKKLDGFEGDNKLLHTPKEFDLVFQPRKIGSS